MVQIGNILNDSSLIVSRSPIAENWRRRGKFEEVAFVFPNVSCPINTFSFPHILISTKAPEIPITVVRELRASSCRRLIGNPEFWHENAGVVRHSKTTGHCLLPYGSTRREEVNELT